MPIPLAAISLAIGGIRAASDGGAPHGRRVQYRDSFGNVHAYDATTGEVVQHPVAAGGQFNIADIFRGRYSGAVRVYDQLERNNAAAQNLQSQADYLRLRVTSEATLQAINKLNSGGGLGGDDKTGPLLIGLLILAALAFR